MLAARFLVFSFLLFGCPGGVLAIVEGQTAAAQNLAGGEAKPVAEKTSANLLPPAQGRIVDSAAVFSEGDAVLRCEHLNRDLDRLRLETGCEIFVATLADGTGNSAKKAAEELVAKWVPSGVPGAILVYDQKSNSFGVSATDAALAVIPAFLFALMEQTATSARADSIPHDTVSLAVGDLEALFRKHFSKDAGEKHPAVKADLILFAVVSATAVLMVAAVAFLSWRRQQKSGGI